MTDTCCGVSVVADHGLTTGVDREEFLSVSPCIVLWLVEHDLGRRHNYVSAFTSRTQFNCVL